MNWLLWLLPGIPAYLAIGQILGRLTIAEFKNETPSEKLSLIRKGVRMLMFPTIHRDWKKSYGGWATG